MYKRPYEGTYVPYKIYYINIIKKVNKYFDNLNSLKKDKDPASRVLVKKSRKEYNLTQNIKSFYHQLGREMIPRFCIGGFYAV